MMKKILPIMIVAGLMLSACAKEEAKKPSLPTPLATVKTLDLNELPSFGINEVATIKPLKEVELIAKTSGNIDQLSIKLGDSVQEGQTVAVINLEEANNPAKVNYQTAALQLSNAQQTLDESQANNQDAIERAALRVESLQKTIDRLERNREELTAQNQSSETSLNLQIENAQKNAEIAENNYNNLIDKFNQSEQDLLNSTKTSLDSILVSLESNFTVAEDILNPTKSQYFNVSMLAKGIGAANSIKRSDTVNRYSEYRREMGHMKENYETSLPLTNANVDMVIGTMKSEADELRKFLSEVRILLNFSVADSELTQTELDGYLTLIKTSEASVLADLAKTDTLLQSIAGFRLDKISQISNAENNKIIAQNQLSEAKNALTKFKTDSAGGLKDMDVQIQQTQNDLLSAQADLDSAKRNSVIQNSSKKLEISTLANQLKLAENTLKDNKVISTISGVVSSLNVDAGDYVTPGTSLGKVIQNDQLKVVFYLPKEQANRLYIGQGFSFRANGRTEEFKGFISKISPTADPQNKKIMIEGAVENKDSILKPEMFVSLEMDLSGQTFDPNKIYVPMNAIIFAQNNRYVYAIENGTAIKKPIEIGEIFDMWVEVVSGLERDDQLIIEGQRNLPPSGGVKVNVIQ